MAIQHFQKWNTSELTGHAQSHTVKMKLEAKVTLTFFKRTNVTTGQSIAAYYRELREAIPSTGPTRNLVTRTETVGDRNEWTQL